MDELSEHADNEYFYAESIGRSGADCSLVFQGCKKSLLEHFSDVRTFKDMIWKQVGQFG